MKLGLEVDVEVRKAELEAMHENLTALGSDTKRMVKSPTLEPVNLQTPSARIRRRAGAMPEPRAVSASQATPSTKP